MGRCSAPAAPRFSGKLRPTEEAAAVARVLKMSHTLEYLDGTVLEVGPGFEARRYRILVDGGRAVLRAESPAPEA